MKVLIVKTSSLGDVVHALPVLSYLRSAAPSVAIDWVVEEPFAPLLENHPLLRKVYRIDTQLWRRFPSKGVRDIPKIIRCLRRERYDVALDLQGNIKSGVLTFFSGAPLRYGFDAKSVRERPNLLATHRRVSLTQADYHITDRSLKIASSAFPGGRRDIESPFLFADKKLSAEVESRLESEGLVGSESGKKLVLFHPGTTWKTKCWPVDLWKKLAADLIAGHGSSIALILSWGNEAEKTAAQEIQSAVRGQAITWPRGSLRELLALLARVDLVVGGDTGPIHIAAALGTSTVTIFRATHADRNGPRGENHIRLQSPLPCSPCLLKNCPRDGMCGHSIGVDAVSKAVRNLLAKCRNAERN